MLIDYTSHDAVKANTLAAIERGVGVVIGTSGLTAADFEEIDAAARERGIGVIAAGNFSLTAAMAQAAALLAARHLPQLGGDRLRRGGEGRRARAGPRASWPSGSPPSAPPAVAQPPDAVAGPREARGATIGGDAGALAPAAELRRLDRGRSSGCPTSASRSATTPAARRRRTSRARCSRPARWPAGPA